jgi:hypothetical protein
MSNFNLNTIDEQLLTDLTAEESEQASGGWGWYTIGNKSGLDVNYSINGEAKTLKPNETQTAFYWYDPTVAFDSKIGPGYEPTYQTLTKSVANFDRVYNPRENLVPNPYGDYLVLMDGSTGPVPNISAAA